MKLVKKTFAAAMPLALIPLLQACVGDGSNNSVSETKNKQNSPWHKIESEVALDPIIEAKVAALLSKMTLEQKVAQMIQPEIRDITPEDMRKYGFGSYLNGGGAFPNNNKHSTPQDWITLAEQMYQASIDDSLDGSTIPTIWGTDAVHGHNNVIGATLFPHNIGLGAANNPVLMEKIAKITATEVMVTGIDWVFAPTVATVRDDRWGRTYEGYSEDPEIVRLYAGSVVKGLQGHANDNFLGDDRVVSTVKHFLGDGGTENGDDQGNNLSSENDLYKLHAQGYVSGLAAGAQSVMASFNSWNGDKIHGNKYLLTDVLKSTMGFDGFVVGDWNGHGQITGCSNENCPQAINAGLDIFMVPTGAWKPLLENTIEQAKNGVIPMSRIDDAVTRILRVKFRAGIFDKPSPKERMFSGKTELIGSDNHRAVARQAVRESLVLLKNSNELLPLSPRQHILVAGDGADNIGKQSGGWTITWQGTGNTNNDFPGGTSIYQGIKQQVENSGGKVTLSLDGSYSQKPDVAVVVFGENPYAEGQGDLDDLNFEVSHKSSLKLLNKLKQQNIPVVSVFISGRPMWVNAELNASNAFVAAWLPGSEGQGIADVILADEHNKVKHDFVGKLSFSWPNSLTQTTVNRHDANYNPLFPYGYGLTYADKDTLTSQLNEKADVVENSAVNTKKIDIFKGGVKAPLSLSLFSGDEVIEVSASAHRLSELSYRTIDKVVQEDAFKLILQEGSNLSGVRISVAESETDHIFKSLEQNSYLNFSVKLPEELSGSVMLSIGCNKQKHCDQSVDISKPLASLATNQWHEVSISLSCFTLQDVHPEHLTTPFQLASSHAVQINIADIFLNATESDSSLMNCQ